MLKPDTVTPAAAAAATTQPRTARQARQARPAQQSARSRLRQDADGSDSDMSGRAPSDTQAGDGPSTGDTPQQHRSMGTAGALTDCGDTSDSDMEVEPEPDPLYDPEADDADEQWMTMNRGTQHADTVLSCPGCFTTLCVDCQQHEQYHDQWRAMFTLNTRVDLSRKVVPPTAQQQRTGSARKRGRSGSGSAAAVADMSASTDSEVLYQVVCDVCDTEVGVVEADTGLYEFYSVLASGHPIT